jgi:hypothetical protein
MGALSEAFKCTAITSALALITTVAWNFNFTVNIIENLITSSKIDKTQHTKICAQHGLTPSNMPLSQYDCTLKDPDNLYMAGKFISDVAIKTRQNMDKNGHLYVIFGELHNMPSYKVLEADLATRLSKHSKTNIAVETESSYLSRLYLPLLKNFKNRTDFVSLANRTKLPIFCSLYDLLPLASSISTFNFNNTVLYNNIHMTFVDAAMNNDHYRTLDLTEKINLKTLNAEFPHIKKEDTIIFPLSPIGVALRNHSMVTRTIQSAKDQHSDITILTTGMAHVGGHSLAKFSYDQSLSALFNKAKTTHDQILIIAPIPQNGKGLNLFEIPNRTFSYHHNMVIIRNTNNAGFEINHDMPEQRKEKRFKSEYAHLKKLLQSYPKADNIFVKNMTTFQQEPIFQKLAKQKPYPNPAS